MEQDLDTSSAAAARSNRGRLKMTDKFTFRAKLEQAGAGQPVLMSGPWRDVTGGVAASAKYQLEALPEVAFDLSEASLPPDGSYPGRMSLGGGPNMVKKQQLVDRMALRFRREGDAVVGEGEGSNRVGRYSLEAECEKTGSTWEVEVRRTYRPVAVPLARQDSEVSKKRSAESSPVYDEGPRKPRAAAPPKGAWGAAKREEKSAQDDSWDKKKKVKTEDQLPCVAVVFPSEHRQASAKRRPNLAAAREHLADLQLERDAAIRVPSDQGDGQFFFSIMFLTFFFPRRPLPARGPAPETPRPKTAPALFRGTRHPPRRRPRLRQTSILEAHRLRLRDRQPRRTLLPTRRPHLRTPPQQPIMARLPRHRGTRRQPQDAPQKRRLFRSRPTHRRLGRSRKVCNRITIVGSLSSSSSSSS